MRRSSRAVRWVCFCSVYAALLVALGPVSAAEPDRNREVAEWVIARKGSIQTGIGPRKRATWVGNLEQLPTEPFKISGIGLSRTGTTDAELERIAGVAELRLLHLNDCPITGPGLVHLAGLTELQELSFYNGKVDDTGLRRLAGLKKLRILNLQRTPVTDETLAVIGGFPELVDLNLESTRISDAGLKHLSALPKLEKLILAGTAISDAGLAEIAKIKSLKQVMVHACSVTDAGVLQLAELPQLRHVSVRISFVTEAGRDALQAKLAAGAKIEWEAARVLKGKPATPVDVRDIGMKFAGLRPMEGKAIEGVFRAPLPPFLEKATVFIGNGSQRGTDPALGRVEVSVEKKMGVYLAARWEDEHQGGDPNSPVIPMYRLIRDGWTRLGELYVADAQARTYTLFWRPCEAGEKFQLQTRPFYTPWIIVAAQPDLDPLPLVPTKTMSQRVADMVTYGKLRDLLQRKKFAELEAAVARIRDEGGRDRHAVPRIDLFYDGVEPLAREKEEFAADLKLYEAWAAAYPKSVAAQIALAHYWERYGFAARYSEWGRTAEQRTNRDFDPSREPWTKARGIVAAAYSLAEQDPHLYALDVGLAAALGAPQEELDKIIERSLKFDPDYTSPILTTAAHLYQRRHTDVRNEAEVKERTAAVEKWAARAATMTKERWGDAVYALIAMRIGDMNSYSDYSIVEELGFSYPRLKKGLGELHATFPNSVFHAHFAIRAAGHADDRPEAQIAFAQLDRLRKGPGSPDEYTERRWRAWSQDNFAQGDQERTIDVVKDRITRIEFLPEGKQYVVFDDGYGLNTFDAATHQLLGRKRTHGGDVYRSTILPSGKKIIVVAAKSHVASYTIPDAEYKELGNHKDTLAGTLSPDGLEYATIGADRKIRFWNVEEPQDFPDEWDLAPLRVTAVSYLPGGKQLVVGGEDGRFELWNRETKEKSAELPKQAGRVWYVLPSADGELLAVQALTDFSLWRVKSRERIAPLLTAKYGLSDVAFSRDGKYIAAAVGHRDGMEDVLLVWNAQDGTLKHTFKGHKKAIRTVAFSFDGKQLLSGGDDRTIRVWKVE